jgi:PIN domain
VSSLTLDAGALIALERGDRMMLSLAKYAEEAGDTLTIPAGVLAQVWRDGSRQVRLSRLLALDAVEVEALDEQRAKAAGQLCGVTKTRDVVDASVVLCAKARGQAVVSSDPDDLLRLDPALAVIRV